MDRKGLVNDTTALGTGDDGVGVGDGVCGGDGGVCGVGVGGVCGGGDGDDVGVCGVGVDDGDGDGGGIHYDWVDPNVEDGCWCCPRGLLLADLVTEQYRSRALMVSLVFLYLTIVILSNVFGTGLPCGYTHIIDPTSLHINTTTCQTLHPNDYNGYPYTPTEFITLIGSYQTIKLFFGLLGNTNYHSGWWLLISFGLSIYFVIYLLTDVPNFCNRHCYFPNGTIFIANTTEEKCALLNCEVRVNDLSTINDMFMLWGVFIVSWFDLLFHVIAFFEYAAQTFKGYSLISLYTTTKARIYTHLHPIISEVRYPAHLFIGLSCNLFLGTFVTIAAMYAVRSTLHPVLNVLHQIKDQLHKIDFESIGLFQTDSDVDQALDAADITLSFIINLFFSIELTTLITAAVSYLIFLSSNLYCLYAFRRDAAKFRDTPPLKLMEISLVSQYIGAFISNCLFALIFSWVVFGLIIFCLTDNFVRNSLLSLKYVWMSLLMGPIITYLTRLVLMEYVLARPNFGIKYPKTYRFVNFLLVLSSTVSGPTYGLIRIGTSFGILLLMIHRVDWSLVPAPFETWDSVYMYYRHLLNLDKLNYELKKDKAKQMSAFGERMALIAASDKEDKDE